MKRRTIGHPARRALIPSSAAEGFGVVEANSDFVAAIAATDFAPRYYELCRLHPLRLDVLACKAPAADVLRIARTAGPASKLPGPGRTFGFELPGGPVGGELVFVIQGRTTIEAHFAVPFRDVQAASTFAILALDVQRLRGQPLPIPPYPRPEFHTLDELTVVLAEVYSLGCLVAAAGQERQAEPGAVATSGGM